MDELTDLRIVVRPSPETNDHEVCLLGNGEDLIRRFSDGMIGLDPNDILLEPCPLRAELQPRAATIARCDCGVIGCGSIDVAIERSSDVVTWRSVHAPVTIRFSAGAYDAEVERALHDHNWETPERTAARLIRERLDRVQLQAQGLKLSWASRRVRNGFMVVALRLDPGPYQLLVHVPWTDETPEGIARMCALILSAHPHSWNDVRWFEQVPGLGPPPIAGPGWRAGTA